MTVWPPAHLGVISWEARIRRCSTAFGHNAHRRLFRQPGCRGLVLPLQTRKRVQQFVNTWQRGMRMDCGPIDISTDGIVKRLDLERPSELWLSDVLVARR
jgi:hypothetical protein